MGKEGHEKCDCSLVLPSRRSQNDWEENAFVKIPRKDCAVARMPFCHNFTEAFKGIEMTLQNCQFQGGLFESPHTDDNDVQTIAKKCEVLPFKEFREKYGHLCSAKSGKSHKPSALKGIYYVAGNYNPFTCNLTMADLK